jgi:hypothetical protein
MKTIQIRNPRWKNSDSASGINIPDPEIHSSVPGLRIFSVSLGDAADTLPVITDMVSGSDKIFHKIFPGLETSVPDP